MRNQIFQNLYITYGAVGSGVLFGTTKTTFISFGEIWVTSSGGGHTVTEHLENSSIHKKLDWYSVGAFVGLDLQMTRHFLISAKINPYLFESFETKSNEVFSSGSINLAYVF